MSDAEKIVAHMFANDAFSQWLGIKIIRVDEGSCELEMTVRSEMTNGFKLAHGGISYCLGDSALAFAANGRGQHALSIETSIGHLAKVRAGDILKAKARETHKSSSVGRYDVEIINQDENLVAHFKGIVYFLKKDWDLADTKTDS